MPSFPFSPVEFVDRTAIAMRSRLPSSISPTYFDGFIRRNRGAMIEVVEGLLLSHGLLPAAPAWSADLPAELWSSPQRTQANLRAMELLARKDPEQLTDEDRRVVAQYSGWGGLSIERVQDKFPQGFPVPDAKSLIHEYYTPSKIANEVARVLAPLLPELVKDGGTIQALEPSAGIGRFLKAFSGLRRANQFPPPMKWTAVELSPVSARLVHALFPEVAIYNMPFERWIREYGQAQRGTFNLIIANPPYGPRGALIVEDSDKDYRVKQAHLYFLLRGLDLLAQNGVGAFLLPAGFMTSTRFENFRARVLRSHHLLTAYRLPSESPTTKDSIFPGVNLVTDLIFFQARGGTLAEPLPDDQYIVEGRFYEGHPHLVLGEQYNDDLNDDHTARPRYRYAVIGEFNGLPRFEPRPMQQGVMLEGTKKTGASRGGLTREEQEIRDLPSELASAVQLGMRVDRFLESVARGDSDAASQGYPELKTDLDAWVSNHGNPYQRAGLLELARRSVVGAERFLSAFTRNGLLAEALSHPPKHDPVYRGEPTLLGQADWTYRQYGKLLVSDAVRVAEKLAGHRMDRETVLQTLTRGGWCVDGDAWNELVPEALYYAGDLWPKVDRCRARAATDRIAADQHAKLQAQIKPSVFEDIVVDLSPREPWLPLNVVTRWVQDELVGGNKGVGIELERESGLLQPSGWNYEDFTRDPDPLLLQGYSEQAIWFIGWANHHLALFRPPQPSEMIDGVKQKVPLDEVRLEVAKAWIDSFGQWLRTRPEFQSQVEDAYNRTLRGYVAPAYTGEAVHIERWAKEGPKLFPYQWKAARRILTNRCGLLAFDVGLGKTYTGITVLARARQEGWARRPVVLVPNSIVWKWYRDFGRCLPDYKVLVIGSKRKVMTSGKRKGRLAAEPDTPLERAEKWSAFQAGRADVVLLTYSAMGRTRVNPERLYEFVDDVAAIQRQIQLARSKSKSNKELTERKEATLQQSVEQWVSLRLEANGEWEYDPGIEWDALGVDYLMVDESQNFKNLFMPEAREGGIPDAMGGSEESKRAWQLNFRCASVRRRTGGAGVVLLSATPAKNGPVEFFNAIHLIDPKAWDRVGITDPEAFIDRYCAFEARPAVTSEGKLTVRQACTAFKNLHELRDVVFRYADFQTAEDVGLKIPEASNEEHRVDLDADQIQVIQEIWDEIRELREDMKKMHGEKAQRAREIARLKQLGLAMKVDLVAIHPKLPGASKLSRAAIEAIDPHSGKIDAVVKEIMATDESTCSADDPDWCLNCGHVVFIENIAVHTWIKKALIEGGIPAHRIAILNAKVADDPETRQQIAERFNGSGQPGDEDYEPPEFDVVIANSVAYEGVDLQRRTCAIHHLDLPWEPATLQQRNGRGVRQGNRFERVRIHYYLGRPSGDGRRLSLISKKRSWMTSLVKGQDRVTNNPAATLNVSVEDILLDIVPASERERVLREREEEAKEAAAAHRKRVRIGANRMLGQANARFRRADQLEDPAEASRLRLEGEAILADLGKIDVDTWPWLAIARQVREHSLWIPEDGPPLRAGMKVMRNGRPVEIGVGGTDENGKAVLGYREAGDVSWDADPYAVVDAWAKHVTPADFDPPAFPNLTPEEAITNITNKMRYSSWPQLGFYRAPQAWLERWWPVVAPVTLKALAGQGWRNPWVPVVMGGRLKVAFAYEVAQAIREGEVLAPTDGGWRRFLELAPESGHKFTELANVARYWWDRPLPRDVLSASRRQPEQLAALREPFQRRLVRQPWAPREWR